MEISTGFFEVGLVKSGQGMDSLEPHDRMHLNAAEGWLGLGNHVEANEDLEKITPAMRSHPDVLEVRYEIYASAKRWDACLDIAEAIVKLAPESSFGWIRRSFALHELKKTKEALEKLLPVADRFPKLWLVPYNLACYCAQLGRLDECQEWFKKAMVIDEQTVKRAAIDDPDLEPLWGSMGGTVWKRGE
jgi:tetratricopeptide (TPR) repeat protein